MKKFVLILTTALMSVSCANAQKTDVVEVARIESLEEPGVVLPKMEHLTLVDEAPENVTSVEPTPNATVEQPMQTSGEQTADAVTVAQTAHMMDCDAPVVAPESDEVNPLTDVPVAVASEMVIATVEQEPMCECAAVEESLPVAENLVVAVELAEQGIGSVEVEQDVAAVTEVEQPTTARFLPTRKRVDRKVDNNIFVYKGEFMLGLTASYGRVSSEDSDLLLLLDGINVGLNSATIRPFFAYAYKDNLAVGIRLGYEYIHGDLSNIGLNLGLIADGMEGMSIGNLSLRNENFSWALFHRHYLGLDRKGIVGVILETELLFKNGTSRFTAGSDVESASFSRNFAAQLNVNPGIGVYIFPQACVTATVGIGGLKYNNIRQCNAVGEVIGRRDHSSLDFKINILNVQIGVVMHLWSKKK